MMPWYMTLYRANGLPPAQGVGDHYVGSYGGHLWARNPRRAREQAKRRRLGEEIVSSGSRSRPYDPPSVVVMRPSLKAGAVWHSLCFLGQIALLSGATTVPALLGDGGVMHEYAHFCQHGFVESSNKRLKGRAARIWLRDRLREIERQTPGFVAE